MRYRVQFSANASDNPRNLGFVTGEKETTVRKRFEASGDVGRIGVDGVIVLVDGGGVYFCSSNLQVSETRTEPGCYTGDVAKESAGLFAAGVGLSLGLTHTARTDDLALIRAWKTDIAGVMGTCFEYGSATLASASPIRDCFSDTRILLSRRFTFGENVTQIEAVDVGLPVADDFAIPYPLKESGPSTP